MQIKMLPAAALTALLLAGCMSRPVVVDRAQPDVSPSPSYAEPMPAQDRGTLHDRIHDALVSGMGAAGNDVTVRVDGSKVFLGGHVKSRADAERAHSIAHDFDGVTSVDASGIMVH